MRVLGVYATLYVCVMCVFNTVYMCVFNTVCMYYVCIQHGNYACIVRVFNITLYDIDTYILCRIFQKTRSCTLTGKRLSRLTLCQD